MVSPETQLVKNYESQSRPIESQLKKAMNPKLKMRGPLCNQIVNLKTDSQNSAVTFTEIKVYSFCCKAQQKVRER